MQLHSAKWLAGFLLGVTPMVAAAEHIATLTFESLGGIVQFENLVESGFRISPNCHTDITPFSDASTPSDGNTLGWDCGGGIHNPDYLGPPLGDLPDGIGGSLVFIDNFEHPFSFLSFDGAGFTATVVSSKGGVFDFCPFPYCGDWTHFELSGSEWEGVKWIVFAGDMPGAPITRVDNLAFRVPSPGTLALLVIGLAGLAFSRRGKRC